MRNITIPREKIEHGLRWGLPLYLWTLWWATAAIGYFFYQRHSVVVFGDWLINYQGGWTRRGLLGEIVLAISRFSSLNPGLVVWGIWNGGYALLLWFVYQALKRQPMLWPLAFLIFAPHLLAFPVNLAFEEFLRKELLYHGLLFGLVAGRLYLGSSQAMHRLWQIVLYGFPLLILSHEALVLYLPYLLLLSPSSQRHGFWRSRQVVLPLLLAGVAFGAAVWGSTLSPQGVRLMESNVARAGFALPMNTVNAFTSLSWHWSQARAYWWWNWHQFQPWKWCLLALPLSLVAFVPVSHRLRYWFQRRDVRWAVGLSLLGTLALAWIATDWGRFWRIHLMSWFALTLSVPTYQGKPWPQEAASDPIPVWQLALLALYALGWRLGFQCKIFPSFLIQLTWPLWHR